MAPDIVDEKRLLELVPLSKWQLQRLRARRKVPFLKIGHHTLRYQVSSVVKALRKLEVSK
jgi:hypothetical protein